MRRLQALAGVRDRAILLLLDCGLQVSDTAGRHSATCGPTVRSGCGARARRSASFRWSVPATGPGRYVAIISEMDAGGIVAELWRCIQARDWTGLAALLADDFVLEWPNARLRIRGRTNYVAFNRAYPEGWSIEILRIVAQRNVAVSEVHVPHPTVGPYFALSFFEIADDRVIRGREYWIEELAETPAPERAKWFEAM